MSVDSTFANSLIISLILNLCYHVSYSCIVDNLETVQDEYPRSKVTQGSWHLDMDNPMPCSGYVQEIKLHYFKKDDNHTMVNYCVSIAMFKATTNNQYTQVQQSLQTVCITDTSQSEGVLNVPITTSYPVTVGSVVGIYHSPSTPVGIFLVSRTPKHDDEPAYNYEEYGSRVCRTTQIIQNAAQYTNITCDLMLSSRNGLRIRTTVYEVTCSNLINPVNGVIYYDPYLSNFYGAVIEYSCNYGYQLVGNKYRTCQLNATWTGVDPICVLPSGTTQVQCTSITSFTHGTVQYSRSVSISSVASFSCSIGYTLNGSQTTVCQASGRWSQSIPSCTPVQCPTIPASHHHMLLDNATQYHYGVMVIFYCPSNDSVLVGSQVIRCQANGRWNDSYPHCSPINTTSPSLSGTNNPLSDVVTTIRTVVPEPSSTIYHSSSCIQGSCSTIVTTSSQYDKPNTAVIGMKHASSQRVSSSTVSPSTENEGFFDRQMWLFQLDVKMFIVVVVVFVFIIVLVILGPMMCCVWFKCKKYRNKVKLNHGNLEKDGNGHIALRSNPVSVATIERQSEVFYDTPTHRYDYLTPYQNMFLVDYEEPALEEKQLYVQLDRIKVKNIQLCDIVLLGPLGSGQFGTVHYSVWDCNNDKVNVAVKTLQEESTERDRVKFLQEATIMGQFKHKNVLALHGIVHDNEKILLVIELMVKGDLKNYLKQKLRKKVSISTPSLLLKFSRQICNGMCYLSSRGYVHRDLAARNILISEDYTCKISDFGMSRDLEDGYYLAQRGGVIPFKWTAPEAINYRKYSTFSDVWSYGCVLYEIWSLGQRPFDNVDSRKVLLKLERGYRLPPPPGCPRDIYEVMINTWHPEPKERPDFTTIMMDILQENDQLLTIPEEDKLTHPLAGSLTGDLGAGDNMYKDLQNRYSYYFTIYN